MPRRLSIGLLALCMSSGLVPRALAENSCEREMAGASAKYDVPIGVLYAVGLAESGRRNSLQPNAMNIDGKAYYASSLGDGLREFQQAQTGGARMIDIGCMQINYAFHGDHFGSVAEMFDPRRNVDYGTRFLQSLRQREGSWTLAVARYHAGPNNNPAQKQYVCAVIANMVATGFGAWTPAARAFCQ
jgi:soluble lytic murein transglycosylase-like protein